ncbi:MAG: hypothetical protein Q4Q06_03720 [Bacteroidota bacterium]|nr:hypothetical protein [Bacteroidota bacterium]
MKRLVVLIMMVGLAGLPSFAQKQLSKKTSVENPKTQNIEKRQLDPEQMIKMHEMELEKKLNVIQKELFLDKEAMERFGKVYREYDRQVFQINIKQQEIQNEVYKNYIQDERNMQRLDVLKLKEEDAEKLLKQNIEAEKQTFDLTQRYNEVFGQILSYQQMLKLREVEKHFSLRQEQDRTRIRPEKHLSK